MNSVSDLATPATGDLTATAASARRWLIAAACLTGGAVLALALRWALQPLGPGGFNLLACLAGTAAMLYIGLATAGLRQAAIGLIAVPVVAGLALAAANGSEGPPLAGAFAAHAAASFLLCTSTRLDAGLHRLLSIWGGASATLTLMI